MNIPGLHEGECLGRGNYGRVSRSRWSRGQKSGGSVAVKTIDYPWGDYCNATYTEICCGAALGGHPYIVRLLWVHVHLIAPSLHDDQPIALIMEEARCSLADAIDEQRKSAHARSVDAALVFYQLVCAVKYIHSAGIVHYDVNPSNILLAHDGSVRLCDFGAAGVCGVTIALEYANAGGCYRAPERLLGQPHFTFELDYWSLGCVFYEVITRSPLISLLMDDQMVPIMIRLLKEPTREQLNSYGPRAASRFSDFASSKRPAAHKQPQFPAIGDKRALEVLNALICWPEERLHASQLLQLAYLSELAVGSIAETRLAPRVDLASSDQVAKQTIFKKISAQQFRTEGFWSPQKHKFCSFNVQAQIMTWLEVAKRKCIPKELALLICSYICTF